ncbi:Hypothetical predicted protein [Mytilus galloprovincialis]|uniref:Uncharacterized protein n=1 Tax=Mytilus galloprovincialis TaxID=29158 RepID=A0A8B6C492_MYTGA|nr:Hypothetical predicted protein [Mytilus galloprovincialis]
MLKIGLLEYQVEVILGIVLCLISIIMTFRYKKEGTNGGLVGIIVMYIIAGISTSVAVGRWLHGVLFISTYSDIPMIVPYSLILSAFGAIFCGITMICVSCMNCQHNDERLAQRDQVYSGVAMTDYPQTTVTEGPPPYEQPQGKNTYV